MFLKVSKVLQRNNLDLITAVDVAYALKCIRFLYTFICISLISVRKKTDNYQNNYRNWGRGGEGRTFMQIQSGKQN